MEPPDKEWNFPPTQFIMMRVLAVFLALIVLAFSLQPRQIEEVVEPDDSIAGSCEVIGPEGNCAGNVTSYPCGTNLESVCYQFSRGALVNRTGQSSALSHFVFELTMCQGNRSVEIVQLDPCICNINTEEIINNTSSPCLAEEFDNYPCVLKVDVDGDSCTNIYSNGTCDSDEVIFQVTVDGMLPTEQSLVAHKSGNPEVNGGCCACTSWGFDCPVYISVDKQVSGGNLSAAEFSLTIDGEIHLHNSVVAVLPGEHFLDEIYESGYTLGSIVCDEIGCSGPYPCAFNITEDTNCTWSNLLTEITPSPTPVPSPSPVEPCPNPYEIAECYWTPPNTTEAVCVQCACQLCHQVGGIHDAPQCTSTVEPPTPTPAPVQCSTEVCTAEGGSCVTGETGVCGENTEQFGTDACGTGCQCCIPVVDPELVCDERTDQECAGDCRTEQECTELDTGCEWDNSGCGDEDSSCGCCTCSAQCPESSQCDDTLENNNAVGGCVLGSSKADCEDFCEALESTRVFHSKGQCTGNTCQCCGCAGEDFNPQAEIVTVCGDGIEELGEECEDGNTENGDGCSAECELELCPQIIIQSSDEARNCAASELTTTNAAAVACVNFMSESVKIDCSLDKATHYSTNDCTGTIVQSMNISQGDCTLSSGMYAANGAVIFFPADTCYGACRSFDASEFMVTEVGAGGIMPNAHGNTPVGEVVGVTILVIALPLLVVCFALVCWVMRPRYYTEPPTGVNAIQTRHDRWVAVDDSLDLKMDMNDPEILALLQNGKLA